MGYGRIHQLLEENNLRHIPQWGKAQLECEYKRESRSQYPILPYLEAVKQPRFQRVLEERVDGTRYSVEKHEALQLIFK